MEIKDMSIIDTNKRIVVFFFPFRVISGGPIFLSNLAIMLSKNSEYSVYYTEYNDGAAREILHDTSVKIIEYHDEKPFELFVEEEIYLITPVYWGDRVPVLNRNSKVLFLNWHNLCIPSLKAGLRCDEELLMDMLALISETDSEFYCDKAHWEAQELYGIHFREIYVPITVPERRRIKSKELIDPDEINIAVVGRLVIDKVYAITDLIDNIVEDFQFGCAVNIYVIGEGDSKNILADHIKPEYVKLVFCGTLSIEEINNLLSEKADILFAMGTSVLEGASAGLPSVVIPNDVRPFHCNRYAYLFECNSFLLGWGPDQIDLFDIKTHTIKEILDDIYIANRKEEIGKLCNDYYKKNHCNNYNFFLNALNGTRLTYEEYHRKIIYIMETIKEKYRNNIVRFLKKANNKNRKLVIWGAGKRGTELVGFLKKMGVEIDFFVDRNADKMKKVNNIRVKDPGVLNVQKHVVMVSLANYLIDIVSELERRDFRKGIDYLYIYYQGEQQY